MTDKQSQSREDVLKERYSFLRFFLGDRYPLRHAVKRERSRLKPATPGRLVAFGCSNEGDDLQSLPIRRRNKETPGKLVPGELLRFFHDRGDVVQDEARALVVEWRGSTENGQGVLKYMTQTHVVKCVELPGHAAPPKVRLSVATARTCKRSSEHLAPCHRPILPNFLAIRNSKTLMVLFQRDRTTP